MIPRVKGTHDLLDMSLYRFFLAAIEQHLQHYTFFPIETPILEHTELFRRSLGLQTDVVSKEMFTIASANQESESICLRPEATASIMRAFLEHGQINTPWKVYLHGPMFRHERPQKGRFREFHQVSAEIIGSDAPAQDVQFIAMLDRFFTQKLHMEGYALLLNFLGCPNDRQAFKTILNSFLSTIADQLCSNCQVRREQNIMRVFDCKNEQCSKLYEDAPEIAENLCKACNDEWQWLQTQLHVLSVSYSYQPRLVRGLDYYDKVVFEFSSAQLGSQTAFCGGGRYNHLAGQLDAKQEISAIGMAMGIERILMLLELIKDKLPLPQQPPLYLVLPLSKEQHPLALLLVDQLQAAGLCADVVVDNPSIKAMLRAADKRGARYALLLGSDEQANRTVTVRNMMTASQETIPQINLVDYLSR